MQRGVVQIETATGFGSGFLVSETYVLTAAHVVREVGDRVSVVFDDGRQVDGQVVASGYSEYQNYETGAQTVLEEATQHDWALVLLDASQDFAQALPLGESTIMTIGEQVWAMGYPGGGSSNTSGGVLSGRGEYDLRTDAPIDPGHSGGPLMADNQQAVVGILVSVPRISGQPAQSVHIALAIEQVIAKCDEAGYPVE